MPNDELPGTLETKHDPISANASSQRTTAPDTSASTEATPILDLRGYELLERLGGGGMGDVYRAADPALGRDLAVKVMKAELQSYAAAEQRFLREARVTGSLQHPGIVPIYNLGRLTDGRLHYTMRLVRGRTFADILQQEAGRPERLPALLTIFEKVCQAVAYAHSKRVLHRDLKPANVMVGRFGEVQVMDWGLAKLLNLGERGCVSTPSEDNEGGTRIHTEDAESPPELTRLGREMGTPAYMPPEQALGEWDNVDERADAFALGAILCQILTGRTPYSGGDSEEVLRRAKRGDCAEALARLVNCGADAALVELCRQCLSAAREDRPRDAEQVAQRVASYQAEVQERLRRAELERATALVQARWERKKRRWIVAFVLLISAAAVVSSWLAVRATSAAQAERQAKDLAQRRLGEIEKAHEVATSIFRDLDPRAEEKGGPSLRQQLSQHLQRAAEQLDEGAVGDSVAVARLQAVLGYSLLNLGEAKPAIELLSKAASTLDAEFGADYPETLTCRNNLAMAYQSADRTSDAIRLHEQTLKQMESKLGIDHRDTLRARNNLAIAFLSAGRNDDAIHLHEQTLKQMEAKYGTDHLDTLQSRNNLATAYWRAGRINEAILLHEQTLKQMEAKLGFDHADTLTSCNNLAAAYADAGRTADAIRLHKQTVKRMQAKLGPDHPSTLQSQNNLANSYYAAGQTSDAVLLFEQILKQREVKLGADHADTLLSCNNLAQAYWGAGRTDDAVRLLERTLKQMETKLGANHPNTLMTRNNLAEAYRNTGRIDDAIRMHEQILKQREDKLGADNPDTLTSRNNLALAYGAAGRTNEAIPLFEQTLKKMEMKLGPDHPSTLNTCGNLAEAYSEAGRRAEAILLHEQTLKQRETKLGADHPDTLGSRNNLAAAYSSAGRTAEAIRLFEQNLKLYEAKCGADHPDTLLSLANLGVVYREAGRLKEAIRLLETALQRGQQRSGGLPTSLAWLPGNLIQAYERDGQFAKAESICRDSLKEVQRQFGTDHSRTAGALVLLGANLNKQKKYCDAEPLLRQCLDIRTKKQPDAWNTFNTRSVLGEALLGQKKYTEAEPLLVQGYDGMKQRQDKIPLSHRQLRLSEAMTRLVRLYEATGQKEKAADWQKKLQEAKAAEKITKP